eukprot:scaffold85063_cov65-Phaeocystis_antarctica.AAC.1
MGGWSGGRPASGDFPDDAVPFDVFRMRAVGWVGGTGAGCGRLWGCMRASGRLFRVTSVCTVTGRESPRRFCCGGADAVARGVAGGWIYKGVSFESMSCKAPPNPRAAQFTKLEVLEQNSGLARWWS